MKTLLLILLSAVSLTGLIQNQKPVKYYDGEGNEIPAEVVQTLVKSEFVSITTEDQDSLLKYFGR